MYLGLVFVLTVPLLQDFFGLEWPRNDLLLTALGSALGGILAVEALHRFQSRRNARKVAPDPAGTVLTAGAVEQRGAP